LDGWEDLMMMALNGDHLIGACLASQEDCRRDWRPPIAVILRLDAVIEAVVAVAAVTQTSEFSALASECLTVFLSADCQLTKHAPAQFSPSHEYFLVKNLSFVFNSRRCFCSNQSVVKVGIKRDYQMDLQNILKGLLLLRFC